jgi:DNA-directed RNA polymerase specialized sigma24 family protein
MPAGDRHDPNRTGKPTGSTWFDRYARRLSLLSRSSPAREVPLTLEEAMSALVALHVEEREERIASGAGGRRTELVLADAGIATSVIARLLNKKPDTVAKAITRARKASGEGEGQAA